MTEQGNKRSSAPEQSESTSPRASEPQIPAMLQVVGDRMSLPQARDMLREHVTLFVEKLTTGQWYKLQSGTPDDAIEQVVTEVCMEIVTLLSRCIIQLFRQCAENSGGVLCLPGVSMSSSESDEWCLPGVPQNFPASVGSQKSVISKREISQCLGDIIPYIFAEATGVREDISCDNTDKVTELLARELTDVVNSELSRSGSSSASSEGTSPQFSKSFTPRLQTMVKYVVKILKELAAKMSCCNADDAMPERVKSPEIRSSDKDQKSPGTEATVLTETDDSMKLELSETCESVQTPVLSFDADEPDSTLAGGDFHDKTREYVQSLLEAQAQELIAPDSRDAENEEDNQNQVDTSRVSLEAADDIVRSIMTDLDLEGDGTSRGTPGSEAQASCVGNVLRKLKAFFFQIAAKLSILQAVEKLKKKLDCLQQNTEESSLFHQSIEGMVEDMIIPALARETDEGTGELCLYKSIAEDISSGRHQLVARQMSGIISHYLYPGQEKTKKRVRFMVDIQLEVDSFMKLMWNWLNMQVQLHERRLDLASLTLKTMKRNLPALAEVPVHEVQCSPVQVPDVDSPGFVSERLVTIVEEDEDDAESDESEEEAGDEIDQDDEEAGEEHREEAGGSTSVISNEWDKHLCKITVDILVHKWTDIRPDQKEHIAKELSEMLWSQTAGSHISATLSYRQVYKMCEAVKKELCKRWFKEEGLKRLLSTGCEHVLSIIVETLKKHLLEPQKKKTGVKAFFRSVFKKIAKPFTVCFKRRHAD